MRLGPRVRWTTVSAAILALTGSAPLAFSQSAGESAISVSIDVRANKVRSTEAIINAAPAFRVDVDLVQIPVTVTDPLGNPVAGLRRENFHLFEDGVEQEIRQFSSQDTPASIGIVFDASRSMKATIDRSREAVLRLLRRSQPGDEYFLIAFNNRPWMLSTFRDSPTVLEHQVADIRPEGWTALLDAVSMSVREMKHARNDRKVIIVLSDGGDNKSRLNKRELRSQIRESYASVYCVGLLGRGLTEGDLKLLADMSEDTGARMFPVKTSNDLPQVIDDISVLVRNQYVLGYSPSKPIDGLYRNVKVGLTRPPGAPPLRAEWRPGYYAPSEP